ncbi:hypothetical protein AAC387_Pa10g0451 [Persea americana]
MEPDYGARMRARSELEVTFKERKKEPALCLDIPLEIFDQKEDALLISGGLNIRSSLPLCQSHAQQPSFSPSIVILLPLHRCASRPTPWKRRCKSQRAERPSSLPLSQSRARQLSSSLSIAILLPPHRCASIPTALPPPAASSSLPLTIAEPPFLPHRSSVPPHRSRVPLAERYPHRSRNPLNPFGFLFSAFCCFGPAMMGPL